MTPTPTVAVDFDATIHPYTRGWQGPVPDDEAPVAGTQDFLAELVNGGFRVVVFSTRCADTTGRNGILDWLDRYELMPYIADVTCEKPAAVAYIDDRAVPFVGTWEGIRDAVDRLAAGRAHGSPAGGKATGTARSTTADAETTMGRPDERPISEVPIVPVPKGQEGVMKPDREIQTQPTCGECGRDVEFAEPQSTAGAFVLRPCGHRAHIVFKPIGPFGLLDEGQKEV